MKFASLYLSNYIGIYNGMGLYEIYIDMTKCRNRILIIRGDNGSGKSTLSKAMGLFPDPNDSFIPGMPARKEIVLIDGETYYKLSFIHGLKSNGERDTTKAYITKTFNGHAVELNENGNVSSYKDILYSELGLDANFAALSQLSNDDRGLADKKPAERKRFVNAIITSLDTYNNIYKVLTKRSSNYKAMLNAVVGRLNVLGDEKSLSSNLEALESKINNLQNRKDAAVAALAKEQSTIALLDPDGTIQQTNTTTIAEMELAEKDYVRIQSTIDGLTASLQLDSIDFKSEYKRITDAKNSLIIKNSIDRGSIDSLIQQKDRESKELEEKLHKLSKLKSGSNYDDLKAKIDEYELQLATVEAQLAAIGIENANNLTKEEYILALETLKELCEYISAFKSETSFIVIEDIMNRYMSSLEIPPRKDVLTAKSNIEKIKADIESLRRDKAVLESKLGLLDRLALRPNECTYDNCEFIKEAVLFSKDNPADKIDYIILQIEDLTRELDRQERLIAEAEEYNNAVNRFAVIIRDIDRSGAILSKIPNGNIFSNKADLFHKILSGYSFEYFKSIYEYIDMANLFDIYKQTKLVYDSYVEEFRQFEGKAAIIDSINEDIDRINKVISSLVDRIEPINTEILHRELQIAEYEVMEKTLSDIFDLQDKQKPIQTKISECRAKLLELNRNMNDINAAISRSKLASEEIAKCSYALEPLMKERDKALHSLQMMKDYIAERDELQANYDFIETIKYYSSPTTGIQLVFMELYMGKVIDLANNLLKLLFNGQFVIQPFIINEAEFRIPCMGSGYLNDDISSMSSSQIGMISMILSFALLHHSSTKYNIIKLDEIDGPLDYNNRVYFMDVLNNIMDIMGTEQCIMISHNSELQIDNSDVILLRHDESNMDYNRGNIIWRFQ